MHVAGIIIEYDPLHTGHVHLMNETRRALGADTAIIGVMSGNFVQRGEFAVAQKYSRAKAAVESGMDLVLELPLPWAAATAERFADGGVQALAGTGVVTHLAFGSECGDVEALKRLAGVLCSRELEEHLKQELAAGDSFASARQRAVAKLTAPEDAALLARPNNILGVEYCKALLRRHSEIVPVTVPRKGSGHNARLQDGEHPSASAIRELLLVGERERALELMAPSMREAYLEEERAGRAPVFSRNCERAILARLRTMTREDFAALDEGKEGLYNRLYDASRSAVGVETLLESAKTKRYTHARLRRMVLWAYLGMEPRALPENIPYLRPLAANERGRELLGKMRKTTSIPVVMKTKQIRELGEEARKLFDLETRAADLYTLAYPDLSAAIGGSIGREGLILI